MSAGGASLAQWRSLALPSPARPRPRPPPNLRRRQHRRGRRLDPRARARQLRPRPAGLQRGTAAGVAQHLPARQLHRHATGRVRSHPQHAAARVHHSLPLRKLHLRHRNAAATVAAAAAVGARPVHSHLQQHVPSAVLHPRLGVRCRQQQQRAREAGLGRGRRRRRGGSCGAAAAAAAARARHPAHGPQAAATGQRDAAGVVRGGGRARRQQRRLARGRGAGRQACLVQQLPLLLFGQDKHGGGTRVMAGKGGARAGALDGGMAASWGGWVGGASAAAPRHGGGPAPFHAAACVHPPSLQPCPTPPPPTHTRVWVPVRAHAHTHVPRGSPPTGPPPR